jgi:hypothetical protein
MARPSKSELASRVHARAMRTFDVVASGSLDERKQCLQDRRFANIAGAQWEGPLAEQYANKPKFELNKVTRSIRRIFNDMRNHRIDVTFNPKDEDPDGSQRKLADNVMSMMRADAKDSNANQARDNGFDEAVTGGIGAWRLCSRYVDEDADDDERQRISWEPIYDADSCVYFDPASKSMDKSDAKCAFVLHGMTWDAYRDEYNDDPASWPKPVTQTMFDWTTTDTVFVCEYYEVEEKKRTVRVFQSLAGEEERYDDDQLDAESDSGQTLRQRLEITGWKEVRSKKSTKKRVHKWLLNGSGVIDDCGYIAGPNIPIVMTYGNRAVIDGTERAFGHVRMAKDAQRLKNMAMSKIAEIASVSSTRKPIFLPEQVQGHENVWANANLEERAYLTINPITGPNGETQPAGPVGMTEQPDVPPALAALVQTSDADMTDILGNQGGADQLVSNVSGKTVEAIQERLDEQTYLYVDNFAKALQREAVIWLGMARELYVEENRTMKVVDENGESGGLMLQRPNMTDDGALYLENDLDDADFDVDVTIGPSSASKRKAVVTQATTLLSVVQDPQTQQVLTSFILMNMEGEGVGDLNKFARNKLIRLGVVEPTEEEKQDLAQEAQAAAQKGPDPQQQLLQAAAMEAAAKAEKAKAEVLETFAETEFKRAQTARTKAEIPGIFRESMTPTPPLHLRGLRR